MRQASDAGAARHVVPTQCLVVVWCVVAALFLAGCDAADPPRAARTGSAAAASNADPPASAAREPHPSEGQGAGRSASASFPSGKLIDLTHPFNEHTIYWPTDSQGFRLEKGPEGVTERGYYYAANRFSTAEHGGTHLDAPIHFYQDRPTADQVPLSKLLGQAAVVDVTEACRKNPDYLVTVTDLRNWEVRHQRQLVDVILLIRTGYARHWPDREQYLGTAATGEAALDQMHFPGLDPDAAQWLVEHRAIKAVGIDTASIDYGQSTHFRSHVLLCEHQVPIFENVADMSPLPEIGFDVIALPMKIEGGSGGPLRIIAIVPEDKRALSDQR